MFEYKNIAEFENATVAVSYTPISKSGSGYQSEAQMEARLIEQLQAQGYEYLQVHTEPELVANLRRQLELLNDVAFTDAEWKRFFDTELARPNAGIMEKTKMLQEGDTAISCLMDDGSRKNIRLLDKRNVFRNTTQVINQYVPEGGARANRYDVTILVNGLPMVHVELKRRGVNIREAFNQINRYGRESFWAGNGLFEYVQVFVISNGTYTKYYSNTTRERRVKEAGREGWTRSKSNTSNSFEFTSYWADAKNRNIPDIEDFTATFFSRNTLLNILAKYCVFTVDKALLVMRPYQIAATEAIVQRVEKSTNYREWGTIKGGGHIWHATGSGKTLTSYKTARLLANKEGIDKVLFVVDRKDLDYQTMKEYNRFEENAVNGNRNTEILKRQLEKDSIHIIVTTIQKLSVFIKKNPVHDIYGKHVVLIFDECHRSQFGEMHAAITKRFKKYHVFGFTGTPIFPQNATTRKGMVFTTEQTFGDRLHTYTIMNAIEDGNVLKFKVDYIRTFHAASGIDDVLVEAIDKEAVLLDPQYIHNNVEYILAHFAQKTKQDKAYEFRRTLNITEAIRKRTAERADSTRLHGFNSIFATQSIDAAKLYYTEFKRQQEALPENKRLKVGLIYSYGANEDLSDGFDDGENSESTSGLDQSSRDFLDAAIADYNGMWCRSRGCARFGRGRRARAPRRPRRAIQSSRPSVARAR
ncbi:MAG: type I restriction endonuclease subunit R, partial [Bacteroidales bacterium]|nr:type I restriction endonuclease subunit R [Bacteroidales bacterium]